jgi:plastocyanin
MPRRIASVLVLVALAACGGGGSAPAQKPVTPLDRSTTGTITGVVRLAGPTPAMPTLQLSAECRTEHQGPVPAGDVLVHDGLVENAFVYLKEGLGDRGFAVPTEPVTIDQLGCLYHPRVVGVQVGQPIVFQNSDGVLHNVHGTPAVASAWNFTMSVKGSQRTLKLDKPEVMVSVRCDVHPWMQGWIGVVDHPYFAVTGTDGRFTLRDVPPGDYVVTAWHERFGTRDSRVSLAARGTQEVSFGLGGAGN